MTLLTMYETYLGAIIGVQIIILISLRNLMSATNTIGEMLHTFMFHPEHLDAWSDTDTTEKIEDLQEDDWKKWDSDPE
tara:strand:- start:1312 stop:1545 length:234 start_codon:yes stop_codon:yes gene_type:complete